MSRLEIKRFEFTFKKSLMFFFGPSTSYLALQLGCSGILLISSGLQSRLAILERGPLGKAVIRSALNAATCHLATDVS